jgi:hypothetical protein
MAGPIRSLPTPDWEFPPATSGGSDAKFYHGSSSTPRSGPGDWDIRKCLQILRMALALDLDHDAERTLESLAHQEPSLQPGGQGWNFLIATGGYCTGKVVFTTEHGYVGLGPAMTTVGDEVCVLMGAPLPVVLRHAGRGKHLLVGSCYLHRAMDGEALVGSLDPRYDYLQLPEQGFIDRTTGQNYRFHPRFYQLFPHAVYDETLPIELMMGVSAEELEAKGIHLETFRLA